MKAKFLKVFGYQGDAMNLPVADAGTATDFYTSKMGFSVVSESQEPIKRVVLERDGIRMALAENGGDPAQDGCAFHTDNINALRDEFIANGLENVGEIKDETRNGSERFKVFFVVAPDGLCYWVGERQ